MTKLCLHNGTREITRAELKKAPVVRATPTYFPINHAVLVEAVEAALGSAGLVVTGETHSLSGNQERYFGLLQVAQKGVTEADYGWTLGLRNTHDRCFSASMAAGTRVFVCDNLSFCGEVIMTRKHTKNIERDLPGVASRLVGQLTQRWHDLDTRADAYRTHDLTQAESHDLVVKLLDAKVLGPVQVPKVLSEFRDPRHPEHREHGRTVWTMQNAVTETLKGINSLWFGQRTTAMHGVLDGHVGLLLGKN